jgi:hypothetical protein
MSVISYGAPITVQNDLKRSVCTFVHISKENYEEVLFFRCGSEPEAG